MEGGGWVALYCLSAVCLECVHLVLAKIVIELMSVLF